MTGDIGKTALASLKIRKDRPHRVPDKKIIPATGVMILPDGSKDICGEWSACGGAGWMLAAMTAKHGWEWFGPVRGDDRFAALIKRAREMMSEENI